MSEPAWTQSLVMQLMNEYRKRPQLWNPDNELIRLQSAKYDAYAELAEIFNCDIVDIRKKLESVFASNRREKAKVRRGIRSTWFLYEHMSFLPKHLKNVSRLKEEQSCDTSEPEQMVEYLQDSDFEDHNEEDVHYQSDPIKEEVDPTPKYRQTRPQKHRLTLRRPKLTIKKPAKVQSNASEVRILEALNTLKHTDGKRKKDECDTFGEYIAESLRKHDERTQCMIKQAINNILFEQEMKKYNSEQYVVISNVDNTLILGDQDDK